MKRSTLVLAAVVMSVAMLASVGVAQAGNNAACALTGTGVNLADPFGSCDLATDTVGVTRCGTGGTGSTAIPLVAKVLTPNASTSAGVEFCADKTNSSLPIHGRIAIFRDAAGNVTITADGDDQKNSGGAAGWQRYDIRPGDASCKIRARRGSGGSYWTNQSGPSTPTVGNQTSYSGSSTPDTVHVCAA